MLLGFTGLIVTMPARAGAESARSLTAKGNERYAAGDYGAALEAYEQAESNQPDSPEIQFNKGDAFFEQGDYQKARSAYEAAALRVKDLSLEAKSQFNMGNAALFEGQGLLANDSNKALEKYRQSVRHFKEALRINPEIKEAAENLELVRLRIKELQEQIKKQEEEKRAQQKQQEPQEKPDPSKNGEQAPQDAERQGQEPQDQSPPKQDSGRAAGEQQPKQGAPAAGQEKPEEGKGEHAEQAEGEKPQPAELTKEILREEKEHRLQRDRALRSEYQPVEKDW